MTAGPAEELRATVTARAAGTPYRVDPTPEGFDVRLDLADARWFGPLGASGVRRVIQLRVVLDEARSRYTMTDDHVDVRWEVGADGGRVPRLVASARAQRTLGRTDEVSMERTWGIDTTGRPGRVLDYTFSTAEIHALVREPAKDLGWSERAGLAQRVGLVTAIGGGALAVTIGVVLGVLAATGRL